MDVKDGKIIHLPEDFVQYLETVNIFAENMSAKDIGLVDENDAFPVPGATSFAIEKILEYVQYHVDAVKADPKTDVEPWDWDFIEGLPKVQRVATAEVKDDAGNVVETRTVTFPDSSMPKVFEILIGADFLGVKPLVTMLCKYVASQITGKSVEDMRTVLGVVNDFTEKQEKEIKEQYAWATNHPLRALRR